MRRTTARLLIPAALLAGLLTACSTGTTSTSASTETTEETSVVTTTSVETSSEISAGVAEVLAANTAWHTSEVSADVEAGTSITLDGSSASIDGDGAEVDGSTVTISEAGTYAITGTLTDGSVVVDSSGDGTVVLVLDGADLSSSTTSPLQVTDAEDVVVVLAEGSTNHLSDASTYPDAETDEPNAALYSTADLTLTGTGSLVVEGNANDGITSKDGLVIESGTITVTAVDDGIRGKDDLVLLGGTIDVTAGGDALKSDNEEDATLGYVYLDAAEVSVTAGDDGVTAQTDVLVAGGSLTVAAQDDGVKGEAVVVIGGGTVDVTQATEGLEAEHITIAGGATSLVTSDDGVNASSSDDTTSTGESADPDLLVTISGGTLTIDAGGDGLDSNGSLTMTGGTVVVAGPTQDNNGSIDVNGTFDISGGELIAVGSSGMAATPSADSAQSFVALTLGSTQQAGTVVHVVDADGTVLASFTSSKSYASVVYSSADVVAGATYTAMVGGTAGSDDLGGLSHGGSASGASSVATGTAGVESSGMGGGRGR
ncbi:carbohydrate-binding domain-containing protein [Actinotalea sp.]|uniref:carbohydrate-binding domain-containing protein n=1 Tax=Actinotalea sp. TaxID=1872145 RepID=UPI0035663185